MSARDEERVGAEGDEAADLPTPYRTTAGFITALRRDDDHALRQLFHFYGPLLRNEARRMGLGPGDRQELVMTVLGDVVLQLQRSAIMPKDLARYLVSALRNRIRSQLRDASRATARSEQAYSAQGAAGQRVVAECHSAYGLRLAEGHGDDAPALSRAIRRLAEFSAQSLSTLDASLMVGLSNYVPLRELAGREGITYGAARVRVHRLRERFRKLAVQHLATLDVTERQELKRFFRRAGVVLDTAGGSERVGDDKETER